MWPHSPGHMVRQSCVGSLEMKTRQLLGRMLRQRAHPAPFSAERRLQGQRHMSAKLYTCTACRHCPCVIMGMHPDGLWEHSIKTSPVAGMRVMQQSLQRILGF